MKKIFLFLSAVLVSLAMQATLVTKDYNLSDLSKQQESTTWSSNTVTVTNGWDGVAHDCGEYPYNAEDYTELTLELASASEVGVYINVTYSDNTTSEKTIAAGSLIGRIALSSSAIKRIDVKLTAAGSATLSKLYFSKVVGKETETHLLNSDYELVNWDWDNRLQLENTWFGAIHEGDKIVVTYTSEANADPDYVGAQVRIKDTNDEFTDVVESEIIQESQTNATFEIVLREADIEPLKTKGMYINGKKIVINKVDLYTYAQQIMVEKVLNTGNESLGNDWGQHWLHTTDLPTLAAGDELRVTVSAVTGEYPQVNFRHDDNGNNPVVIEGIDATVPKVYSVSLTAAQANDINSGKLFIVGQNNSLSHFAIAQPMSIYDENLLWYGEDAAGDDWGTPVNLPAGKFSGVEVGDILNVLLTELDAEGQLFLRQGNYADFTVKPNFYLNGNCAAPMALSFVINASMKDELQANGLLVSGKKFTVSAVYVIKAEAHTESYFLKVGDAEMATLVLPFNATLPAGVEAYRLTYEGSNAIEATAVSAIQADKPVLIIAAANTDPGYEFVSEEGADTCIYYKNTWSVGAYADGALHGNYANEFSIPNKYEIESVMNYFYVLQNGADGVGFYQLQYWGDVKVNPYRAFLGCSLDLNDFDTSVPAPGRKMRLVFNNENTTTGMESVQTSEISTQKILRNGQIYILRNGVEYNVNGQMTK